MTLNDWIQCLLYMAVLLLCAKPLGIYMANVYEGKAAGLNVWFSGIERGIYRLCGVDPKKEMGWKTYAVSMMLFNALGLFAVYFIQRYQHLLPLNPMKMPAVSADSSFNTAVSFATNTNWQGYGGETTMSYFT